MTTQATPFYASIQQLTERYGEADLRQVTDAHAQQIDVGRASTALGDASAEIDSYLARRYLLPLQDAAGTPVATPAVLTRFACDIAMYRLQTLRASDDIKDARKRYEDVLKALEHMANGAVVLPAQQRPDAPVGGGDASSQPVGSAQFNTPDAPPYSPFAREAR